MIAEPHPEPVEPDEGGLGGGALRPKGIRDTRLIERALREGWPIRRKYRKPIVERQVSIAVDPESSPREATSAARCLVVMSSENAAIALKCLDKIVPDQHAHQLSGEVKHSLLDLQADNEYVEYLRHRARISDCDPGAICQIREPGNGKPLANGEAHGGAGQGTNGHRNGSQ